MLRRISPVIITVLALSAPLFSVNSAASSPNAKPILTQALTDAAHESSFTVDGNIQRSGQSEKFIAGFDSVAQGGPITFPGIGTADLVGPNVGNYFFVKASSFVILNKVFEVKAPTSAEIGVWYKVTKSDPRYDSINPPGGADTVAQFFSYSPVGWSRSTSYEGTATLRGVKVIKLSAASNFWIDKGFGEVTLYVTDVTDPLPFAISGPSGTSGLSYFSKWGTTKVAIPVTDTSLPK